MKFRKHFDYDVVKASDEAGVGPGDEPSLTVQAMAEEADINVLMKRYGVLGKLPENPRVPMYADFTGVKDYRTALDVVLAADEAFNEFPAELRARFGNDPQALLMFVEDPKNSAALVELGLAKSRPVEPDKPAPPVTAAPVGTAPPAPPAPQAAVKV